MHVWNVLRAARWNTGREKSPKIRHLMCTIAQRCRAIGLSTACIDSRKNIKQQYLLQMFSLYGERSNNGWDRLAGCGAPQQISTGFPSWLRYCTDVAQRRSTKPCTLFGRLLGWCTKYTCCGSCPQTEFCQVQNSLCDQVLRSPILAA